MTLDKTTPTVPRNENPFLDWWTREDEGWRTLRRERWPSVCAAIRSDVRNAEARMEGLEAYYLEGRVDEAWGDYIPPAVRLSMIPWRDAEECRRAVEAYVPTGERHLRTLSTFALHGRLIHVESLPMQRFDDEGMRRLRAASEAIFPTRFDASDADATDSMDPAYFLERGKGDAAKPHPFVRTYQQGVARFLRRSTGRDGRRAIVTPSDHVRDYYLGCVRYVEDHGAVFEPEGRDRFERTLREMLTEILFFDSLNPDLDGDAAASVFAHDFRERLEDPSTPDVIRARCEELMDRPPVLEPHEDPPAPEPHPDLRFFRGSKVDYERRVSPDTDVWVEVIARFGTKAERDRVQRLIGKPGRPCSRHGLDDADRAVFDAIRVVPAPHRVRKAGPKAVYCEWSYWFDHDPTLEPLVAAVRALDVELAYVRQVPGDDDEHQEIRGPEMRWTDTASDPDLWESLEKLS